MRLLFRLCLFAGLTIAVAFTQSPENWQQVADLPGVDMSGLSAAQKTAVLKILREQGCSCGCSMQIAKCRMKDTACSCSTGLAAIGIKNVRSAKPLEQGLA